MHIQEHPETKEHEDASGPSVKESGFKDMALIQHGSICQILLLRTTGGLTRLDAKDGCVLSNEDLPNEATGVISYGSHFLVSHSTNPVSVYPYCICS